MSEHTPGPWGIRDHHTDPGHDMIYAGDRRICAVGRRIVSAAEAEANARLIAAAPELLAALDELVRRCDGAEGVQPDGSNMDTRRAAAVLAKVRGDER